MITAPAWYADPHAPGILRYHDGHQWTEYRTTIPARPTMTATAARPGVNHAMHLFIVLFTCGLWLPVWLIIAHARKPLH